jgi:uncharacterized membrane protein (DUF106 family)
MLAFLPMEFWWLMVAFGFLIVVLIVAIVRGTRRTRDPNYVPPVRFVPHWHLMFLAGAALVTIVTAILIPFLTGFMQAWRGR